MAQQTNKLIVHFLFWNTRWRDYLLEWFASLHRFLPVPFPTAILLFLFPSSLLILLFIENVGSRLTIRHQPVQSQYTVCRQNSDNQHIDIDIIVHLYPANCLMPVNLVDRSSILESITRWSWVLSKVRDYHDGIKSSYLILLLLLHIQILDSLEKVSKIFSHWPNKCFLT